MAARDLKAPPAQTLKGVIIYHEDPAIDTRIRQVAQLREEYGYDIGMIAQALEMGRSQCCAYLQQIRLARQLYMAAFPDEFDVGPDALRRRIEERYRLDTMLRNELGEMRLQPANRSNRVGVFKLLMRNMRELEELQGLLISKVEHAGEIGVKDSMRMVLDEVPPPIREEYLNALDAVLAAIQTGSQTDNPGRSGPP